MGPLSEKQKKLFEAQIQAHLELQKPIYHTPINLGINKFKREIDEVFPDLKRSVRNKLIKALKKRSWMDYHGIVRDRGTFPTHTVIAKSVKITTVGIKGAETEIKVKTNETKQK